MNQTLEQERKRLEQIINSRMIGICFLDCNGRLVQMIDGDIALRDLIIDYQKDRILELEAESNVRDVMPSPYPGMFY